MVDVRRLSRLLRGVTEDVARLRRAAAVGEALLGDESALDAVKYRFVTAIEGCIDVAQHVAASERFAAPATNADAMRILARNDVLAPELAEDLAAAVRFRNVLVHRYAEVDDRLVVEQLGGLDRLTAFVAAVDEAFVDDVTTDDEL